MQCSTDQSCLHFTSDTENDRDVVCRRYSISDMSPSKQYITATISSRLQEPNFEITFVSVAQDGENIRITCINDSMMYNDTQVTDTTTTQQDI